jgi:hypothetical protein
MIWNNQKQPNATRFYPITHLRVDFALNLTLNPTEDFENGIIRYGLQVLFFGRSFILFM